jgi:hypothetical protein
MVNNAQNQCVVDLVHCSEFQILENTTFGKLDLFPSSGDGRETHAVLGPIVRLAQHPER